MTSNENILTGYCFLAALTENQNDLFNQVYVPICKRTLSLYSLQGNTHGRANDIKDLIIREYGIDIPIVMVRKLISASFRALSQRARKKYKFNILEGGNSFEAEKYLFSDIEIHYKKGKRNANALQIAFTEYLKSENLNLTEIPSFSDFLNRNKKHLASFFKNSQVINEENIDSTFIHHVNFLELIETNNHDLFEIAKGLYVGSIVASFLEAGFDLEEKFDSKEEYYLDTPIILKALDLQKEEETEPINDLLEIIRKTGGKLKVLSITVDEVQGVIENSINHYNSSTPTTTINEACLRRGKNKAWLIAFNSKLEDNIKNSLNTQIIPITDFFRNKHEKSSDIKALQDERFKKGNALHDVLSYLHVRDSRDGTVRSFQKAKIWFLTSNTELQKFNLKHIPNNGITEIVLPYALTSFLWLKDPSKLLKTIKNVGLGELMANTLNLEIASRELINEIGYLLLAT